jgi:diguanylate cyclase (GGDEF)-like protein
VHLPQSDPHLDSDTERATVLAPLEAAAQGEVPRLIVVSGMLLGLQIELSDAPVIIGRSSECDVCLPHPSVSRQHCRVQREDDRFFIEDLGSTNKTYVNGVVVSRLELSDADQIGVGNHALKFFRGISQEARYHQELIDLAIYDSLTGFLNRRQFRARLDEELTRAEEVEHELSLILIDIDHFKRVNDEHGHLAGDHVLGELARVLRLQAQGGMLLGRLGGEEFGLAVPDHNLQQATALAERLRQQIQDHPFELRSGTRLPVTASFGVAQWSGQLRTASQLLKAADEALYRAKDGGRNCVRAS